MVAGEVVGAAVTGGPVGVPAGAAGVPAGVAAAPDVGAETGRGEVEPAGTVTTGTIGEPGATVVEPTAPSTVGVVVGATSGVSAVVVGSTDGSVPTVEVVPVMREVLGTEVDEPWRRAAKATIVVGCAAASELMIPRPAAPLTPVATARLTTARRRDLLPVTWPMVDHRHRVERT